jgi:hypothetical protein
MTYLQSVHQSTCSHRQIQLLLQIYNEEFGSGQVGWLVGWYSCFVWLMEIKSAIWPPEGHIRRAKLWNYCADALP